VKPLQQANLAVRFRVELSALAALGSTAYEAGGPVLVSSSVLDR